jgi:hypothetical protein
MPRKPNEGNPGSRDDKLTDEARKEIFGKSEEETAPEDAGHNRHYSGASANGQADSAGADRGSGQSGKS